MDTSRLQIQHRPKKQHNKNSESTLGDNNTILYTTAANVILYGELWKVTC